MIHNYFTIAWRSLLNNRLYSIINVFGLTIGISSCLVIYLIVQFELSFNRQIPDAERIFRVYSTFSGGDFSYTNRGIEIDARNMFKEEFTGMESSMAMHTYNATVTIPEIQTEFEAQESIVITEPSYFGIIQGYEWVEGSPETSLTKPMQVVLTEEKAKKYFGTDDVHKIMGREIHYQDSLVLNVSGIIRSLPYRTDFDFTDFISLATVKASFLKDNYLQGGISSSDLLFIKMTSAADALSLSRLVESISQRYNEANKSENGKTVHKIQPLADLHYNSELGIFDNSRDPAHKDTLTTLSVVAVFLLLIAAINFINLETAQAAKRAKEIGVRKVFGSSRTQLIGSFLMQSILLSLMAIVLAFPLAELGLVFFNEFVPPGVSLTLTDPAVHLFLFAIVLIIGVLAGAYPAFVLSSFLPALALKNQAYITSASTRTSFLRKGLIVFQFGFAQLLIIGTMVLISQINFMLNKDLGFNKEAVIYFGTPWGERKEKMITLKDELGRISEVAEISLCSAPPSANESSSVLLTYKNGTEEIKTPVYVKSGDEKYIPLYGMKILSGRNLIPADSTHGIVINETYLKELNLGAHEAIGREIWHRNKIYNIVGVVNDFHIASLHESIKPALIIQNPAIMRRFSLKLSTDNNGIQHYKEALSKIEAAWIKVYPDDKFNCKFLDESIARFYETEQRMSKLTTTAMVMAIIICCLGLFGLVSFASMQRTKEIGIRKVLGATVNNIVIMLTTDFVKLVIFAFIVSGPIAYYGAQLFLEGYAFRINLDWKLFVFTIVASVGLAFLTLCYHAFQSARSNPVESLRNE